MKKTGPCLRHGPVMLYGCVGDSTGKHAGAISFGHCRISLGTGGIPVDSAVCLSYVRVLGKKGVRGRGPLFAAGSDRRRPQAVPVGA